ncbi:hypothetical protein Tco_0144299 [Tanacetum coccineum]
MRIDPNKKQKEATYQVVLDILKLSLCYNAFHITADVPQINMQQIWFTITKIKKSVPNKEFVAPPPIDALVTFLKQLGYKGSLNLISDWVKMSKSMGMSIPDLIMNDDIKDLKAYLTYLALSTSIELQKKGRGRGKGLICKKATVTPSKNGSITAEDNIILDLDVALKLGESISLTKAEEQEEHRRVHETHKLIKRPAQTVSTKEKFDQPQKLKGILMLSEAAQLGSNMQNASKSSKREYRIQQMSTGSSKGAEGEIETLSSDDERTKSEREVAESDKADEETDNDEEIHNDEEVHEDEEVHDDDEKHDNDEVADEEKADEEMPQRKLMKTDQAAKDDQAGALISVTQKEKPELPPTRSSLSLSSDYGNQFLNVSSDVSMVGIVKEIVDIEINSLLDIPVQQEIPRVQQTPLLDVLVSVIPTMTTPTPSTTPPTTEAQATIVSTTEPSPTMLLRLSELEKKVEAYSKVDHSEVFEEFVQANVRNKVRNQLPKAMSEFFEPRLERTVRDVLKKFLPTLLKSSTSSTFIDSFTEYELKNMVYNKMQKCRLYHTHEKHLDIYNVLIRSIGLDEAIAKGEIDGTKVLKKRRHDDKDEDPPADSEKKKQK